MIRLPLASAVTFLFQKFSVHFFAVAMPYREIGTAKIDPREDLDESAAACVATTCHNPHNCQIFGPQLILRAAAAAAAAAIVRATEVRACFEVEDIDIIHERGEGFLRTCKSCSSEPLNEGVNLLSKSG